MTYCYPEGMSERLDAAVKRRHLEDAASVRRDIDLYVEKGYEPCKTEFRAALAAFEVFDGSERAEIDWAALEAVLTDLQECTESRTRQERQGRER